LSQSLFSSVLGVSVKTVEAWESGRNIPRGTAQRMLALIDKEPEIIRKHIINRKISLGVYFIASLAISIASAKSLPQVMQPGKSGKNEVLPRY